MNIKKPVSSLLVIIFLLTACKKESYTYTNSYTHTPANSVTPEISISGNKYIVSPITFSVQARGLRSVEWSFGDEHVANSNIAVHEYYEPKTYRVTARVVTDDSSFTLTEDLNINLGTTERLGRVRRWQATHTYLDSTVRYNGPGAPNPTMKFDFYTQMGLKVKSDHEVWAPENTFFSYGSTYATHFHTDTQAQYIWYLVQPTSGSAVEVVYYYKTDSARILIRDPEPRKNGKRPYGQYYGEYHTID